MDKISALKIAKNYTDLVRGNYDISRAFLAPVPRVNATEKSDIDVAIVLKKAQDILDIQMDLMLLRRKIDLRIEPHPFNETDFNDSDPLIYEILKYGVEI
jgi:predicted nucleotidyltransferase